MSQVELAFCTRPVAFVIEPGIPMPIVARGAPVADICSSCAINLGDRRQRGVIVIARCGHPNRTGCNAVCSIKCNAFDLGATQVDADSLTSRRHGEDCGCSRPPSVASSPCACTTSSGGRPALAANVKSRASSCSRTDRAASSTSRDWHWCESRPAQGRFRIGSAQAVSAHSAETPVPAGRSSRPVAGAYCWRNA